MSNSLIKIISDQNTTFYVKILYATSTNLLYQGITVNGVFHITDRMMATGHYVLKVENHGTVYVGEFDITNN